MNWYLEACKKYATFAGRARRKEYWFFVLFNALAFFFFLAADILFAHLNGASWTGLLAGIYSLVAFIPGLAVTVRRLHDTGRSGWWILINLVPAVGGLIFLIFMFQDSKPGTNQYGANPKGVEV